jgi:hypothetical protein
MQLVAWPLPHQKSRRAIIHLAVYYLKRITQFHSLSFFQNLSQPKNKIQACGKKSTEKAALSKSAAQLPKLKTSSRTDISSRTKQITETLSLKDILETSEGRYAFIDEEKVSYVVQEGEWLEKVFVKTIYKNSVELKEIDGETTIILILQP